MTVTIEPVSASKHTKFMLFGDNSIGKTSLIASGADQWKTLIVRPPVDQVDSILHSAVHQLVVHGWEDMDEAQSYLQHEGHNWDWVWLDSSSAFQDVGLLDVVQEAIDRKTKPAEKLARAKFGPDKGEYRINAWRLDNWIKNAIGADSFNFGVTAWPFWQTQQTEESPESAIEVLMPWIQVKMMPQKICGYMNLVGYYEMVERTRGGQTREARVIHFNKSMRWYAKDQYGAFKDTDGDLYSPTMPKIMDAIAAVRKPPARAAAPTTRRRRRTRRQ